jgi:hypothetical protein
VHVLPRAIGGFPHGFRNGIGFSDPNPDPAMVISGYNRNPEGETPPALDNFSDTRDFDHALVILLFNTLIFHFHIVRPSFFALV